MSLSKIPLSNRNFSPTKAVIQSSSRLIYYNPDGSVISGIIRGDYDSEIIKNYRTLKLNLGKSTSGAGWKSRNSSYRQLAKNLGFNPNNDMITRRHKGLKSLIQCEEVEIPFQPITYSLPPLMSQDVLVEKNNKQPPDPVDPEPPPTKQSSKSASLKHKIEPQSMKDVIQVDWGRKSTVKTCPRCNFTGNTKVQYRIGCCTWACVLGMAFSGICLACSWFPCALDCTKDTLHICSKCQYILGKVPRNPLSRKTKNDLLTDQTSRTSSEVKIDIENVQDYNPTNVNINVQ